jgi:hypothetical protein
MLVRLTASVMPLRGTGDLDTPYGRRSGGARRDNAILTESTPRHAKCLKTRRLGEGAFECDHRPPRRIGAGGPTTTPALHRTHGLLGKSGASVSPAYPAPAARCRPQGRGSGARRERRHHGRQSPKRSEGGCVGRRGTEMKFLINSSVYR